MIRHLLAGLAVVLLSACQPSLKIDPADPWKSLYPWNHNWKEVQKLPDGVEYVVIRKGDGKGVFPNPIDQVEVHYEGRLAKNGEVFDSSYERGETATFPLNRVIPGWTEGLQKMQPGDEFMFWIPWKEAYGEEGRPPIPSKADLVFRVELFKVTPAVSADAAAWAKVTPWPTDSNDVVRKPSGLEYLAVESGDPNGVPPTDRDFVYVHFEGRLEDGSLVEFDLRNAGACSFPDGGPDAGVERADEGHAARRSLDGARAAEFAVRRGGRRAHSAECHGDLRGAARHGDLHRSAGRSEGA